ncbi:GlcG/HbpS family heme-binding protein [Methyloferula stellata]|uniref:GlcG/HbpS family heme-binding protein n=1 Tax=Methyloferula stellata TaxID=876270 RepID=UPI00037DE58F|nr:heme-binding protein [Methyloferula stellata]
MRAIFGLAIGLALIAGGKAMAETPLPSQAPVPEQMPFNIPYGPTVDLAKAKQLAAVAEAEAIKHNWKMAISVVDPSGALVYFEKIDDTQLASVIVSQKKASTAALYRRPTAVFYDAMETGHPSVATLDPHPVASAGGFPLVEGGKLIGAIGCSGGAPVQDAVVCKAAVDTLH